MSQKDSVDFMFEDQVQRLFKNKYELFAEVTRYKDAGSSYLNLIHAVMGISGEAGELLDAIKKHVVYQKPLDIDNVVEELGDIEFYMEAMRQALGLDRDEILMKNIAKLSKRYGEVYSNELAQERRDKAD